MSTEFWVGLLVGIALLFVPYFVKSMPWYVAFAGFALCASVAAWLGMPEVYRPPYLACGLYTFALVAVILGAGYHWTEVAQRAEAQSPAPAASARPHDLHDLFRADFKAKSQGGTAFRLEGFSLVPLSDGSDLKLEWLVMADFGSRSRFLVYYIPESRAPAFDIAKFIAENYENTLKAFPAEVRTGDADQATSSLSIPFSGRIFIYHEGDISDEQMRQLAILYQKKKLAPEFRSRSYPLRVHSQQYPREVEPEDAKKEREVANPVKKPPPDLATKPGAARGGEHKVPTSTLDLGEAQATVRGLWQVWLNRDGQSAEELAGLVLPPDDWMNERLAMMGRPYRVRARGAQFDIFIPPTGTSK